MRIALGIEYDGTDFQGWQRLSHGPSVQAAVESVLSFVADHPVEVTCAGRTDSGVHARCQVVHFDTTAVRSPRAWILGSNSRLPDSVCVRFAQTVPDDFHARFSATSRRYRYRILNRAIRPALEARYVTWERQPLDVDAMQAAANSLLGEHDFSAFRAISCQANSARRTVHEVTLTRHGDAIEMAIEANAFLHHMVRNIVGSLLPVGLGERPAAWVGQLLAGRDRTVAGPTAPPTGLTFEGPRYPGRFGLPDEIVGVR